jgi:SH3-like domain-containing protein
MSALKPKPNPHKLFLSWLPMLGFLAVIVMGLYFLAPKFSLSIDDKSEAYDTPSKSPVPRWVSIRSSKVYARKGPGTDYEVLFVYKQKGLPVQIIAETRDWRQVCDLDGSVSWVRHDMVSARQYALALDDQPLSLRAAAEANSAVKLILKPKALALIDHCQKDWCKLMVDRFEGWTPMKNLWGTQTGPACKRPSFL